MKVAETGYCGCVNEVLKTRGDRVIRALQFAGFVQDYQEEFYELNFKDN